MPRSKRKVAAHRAKAKAKPAKKRRRRAELAAPQRPPPPPETVQESLQHIAQDAVIILRRELAEKAERALKRPGQMSMSDCIALLRLTAEIGEAAKRGSEEQGEANYERLSPEERVQLATLLLKVEYN